LTDEWIKKINTHSGILFIPQKEVNLAICDNMDEPGRHDAK